METPLLCRVCMLTSTELVDLDSEISGNVPLTVLETFNFCTQLNADKRDNLPNHLCLNCNEELRCAYEFIRRAQDADVALRESMEQSAEYTIIRTDDSYELLESRPDDLKLEDAEELIGIIYADVVDGDDGEERLAEQETIKIERVEVDKEEADNVIQTNKILRSARDKAKFSCSQCTTLFATQKELENHLKNLHDNNTLLCNICGKICSSRSFLKTHMFQHKGKKPFACQHCNKNYFTKHGLDMHILSTHSEGKEAKFLCSFCGKAFATKQRLDLHHLSHTGEKNYNCGICEKKFATPFRLRNHNRIHTGEKPYECKTCGIKFTQSNALRCHERIHTGEKPYECKVCGKRFNQNTILKTHMTLHTGKTVQCPLCDKKFSRPSCLILHKREHTGEKPYACYKCPNRYKQKSHLDRHLDTHFGIKHRCNVCGKEYSKRSSLKIHLFEHTEDKPFQCSVCNVKFTRKDKYKAHLKKMHNKILVNNEVMDLIQARHSDGRVIINNSDVIFEIQNNGVIQEAIIMDE